MTPKSDRQTAILLIDCPDRKGLVATIANFLYTYNANILHADQHQVREQNLFLMRVEWDLAEFALDDAGFRAAFAPIARQNDMNWRLEYSAVRTRIAVFVSKQDHCLADLLYRHRSGEIRAEIALIISNHQDAKPLADFYGIPFHFTPISPETKVAVEQGQIALCKANRIDLVVLARYMQILSPAFVDAFPSQIINVHHSFLPAFIGAKPYQRAYARGVKLIGASSHYVTADLDEGPIIEQDVMRVSHRDDLDRMIERGADLEKIVLSRAVRWHTEHRVLLYDKKTVVFD
jgi:formyltetrahydrofolate deformylase